MSRAIRRTLVCAMFAMCVAPCTFCDPAGEPNMLTLEAAVHLAAEHAPVVARAVAAQQSAQADVSNALVPYRATVSATTNDTAAYSADGLSGSVGGSVGVRVTPTVTFSAQANASSPNSPQSVSASILPALAVNGVWAAWPPYALSDAAISLESARDERLAAADEIVLARTRAQLAARHDYQLLQIDIELAKIADEAADAARVKLEHDREVRQTNAISESDLLKSQRDEADARLSRQRAEDAVAADRRALAHEIGMAPDEIIPDAWQGITFDPIVPNAEKLQARADQSDPGLLAARRQLVLAEARLSAAERRDGLTLNLQAGVVLPVFGSTPVVTAGVQGSYNLADGGKLRAAVERAEGQLASAQLDLDSAKNSLADSLAGQIESIEEMAIQIESLVYARDRERLNYLDAQSKAVAGAVTAEAQQAAKRSYEHARLDLDRATVEYQYLADSLTQTPGERPLPSGGT